MSSMKLPEAKEGAKVLPESLVRLITAGKNRKLTKEEADAYRALKAKERVLLKSLGAEAKKKREEEKEKPAEEVIAFDKKYGDDIAHLAHELFRLFPERVKNYSIKRKGESFIFQFKNDGFGTGALLGTTIEKSSGVNIKIPKSKYDKITITIKPEAIAIYKRWYSEEEFTKEQEEEFAISSVNGLFAQDYDITYTYNYHNNIKYDFKVGRLRIKEDN